MKHWLIFLIVMLMASTNASAEFMASDTLPRIGRLVFSEESVGFVPRDRNAFYNYEQPRWFIYVRGSRELVPASFEEFNQNFNIPENDEGSNSHIGDERQLYASSGEAFTSHSAYCDEGASIHRRLIHDGEEIENHVSPCKSIHSLEIIDDELLLGTGYVGERGIRGSGEGIVVQDLASGDLVAHLDGETGLPGSSIEILRRDPYTGDLWVVTLRGFARLSAELELKETYYFHETFDPESKRPRTFLTDHYQAPDPFAVLSRELGIEDHSGFYEAVQEIPESIREDFRLYSVFMGSMLSTPPEFEPLTPFLVRAARTGNESSIRTAVHMLCGIKGSRHHDFLDSMLEKAQEDEFEELTQTLNRCHQSIENSERYRSR